MPSQAEIRQSLTSRIIEAIEQNHVLPWKRPWLGSSNSGLPTNAISKKAYRGTNPLALEIHRQHHGFSSKWYGTWNQWRSLGGRVLRRPDHIKSGSWGARIVFAKPVAKKNVSTVSDQDRNFYLLKFFTVFSADQVSGVDRFQAEVDAEESSEGLDDFAPAEQLIAATEASVFHISDSASYHLPRPAGSWPHHDDGDFVTMPPKHRFRPAGAYYTTIFHELSHWAEVRTQWDREQHGYSMSELVAEIASSFLATELGVPHSEGIENHAAYVKNWLDAMQGDASFIFKASAQASKVSDYLLSFVRGKAAEQEPDEAVGAVA